MVIVSFVGCTKKKQLFDCTAKEMYTQSSLYRKICYHIDKEGCDYFIILSAKYGLLLPKTIIYPYDETLNNKSNNELKQWANNVFKQFKEFVEINNLETKQVTLKFYCGVRYRQLLIEKIQIEYPSFKIVIPMEGMGIGKQLQYLT